MRSRHAAAPARDLAGSRAVAEEFARLVATTPLLSDKFAVCVLHLWPARPPNVIAPDALGSSSPSRSEGSPPQPAATPARTKAERVCLPFVPADRRPRPGAADLAAPEDEAPSAEGLRLAAEQGEQPEPEGGNEVDVQPREAAASSPAGQPQPQDAAPAAVQAQAQEARAAGAAPPGVSDDAPAEQTGAEVASASAAAEPSNRPPLVPHLEPEAVRELAKDKTVVLVPCTFEDDREAAVARQLVPQLKLDAAPARVLMVQLFTASMQPGPTTNDMLLRRHEAMLAAGPHAVLVSPPIDPRSLRDAIEIQCAVDEQSDRRMQGALDAEVPAVSQEEIQTLKQEQERLLWNEIPSVLMQQLPHANPNLPESLNSVGDLTFLRRLGARSGVVYEASKQGSEEQFAVKVIEKETVTSPGLLEGHYRELILLSRTLDHPNISKCLEVLHSQTRLYYVFRFAGPKNLAQVLENRAGWLLPPAEALNCFGQIGVGMAYCHERNVAIRDLAPEHVVMRPTETPGEEHWTLVDFRSSLITQGNNTSSVINGSFPCMAPEVAAGQNYVPRSADRWSLGVLLLEMAAGLGVMDTAVQWVGSAIDAVLAARVSAFFREDDAHEKAFEMHRVQPEERIMRILKSLLLVAPEERVELAGLLHGLGVGPPPVAAAAPAA